MKFSPPKVNAAGGKNVNILNSSSGKTTILSTPLMLTWGVNEWADDNSDKKSYDFSLQFPGEDYEDAETSAFLTAMKAFESKIKTDALEKSREWFGKSITSPDVIDALFTPMLKYPKNKETGEADYTRAPTLRIKIPFWSGEFTRVEVYDMEQQQLFPNVEDVSVTPVSLIQKGCNVAVVIQSGGVWFANGKFGTTWKLIQAVVKPRPSLQGKCHIVVNDVDKGRKQQPIQSDDDDDEAIVAKVSTAVQDSDDDDEAGAGAVEEASEEAETVPEVKKKRIVKRKGKGDDAE